MGLTIHWHFQGPKTKTEAKTIIEKMRQRAMDLPFESVSEIVHFKGKKAQFSQDRDEPFRWLKIAGAIDELVGEKAAAAIKLFPDYEHLEAKGQNQIDEFLRLLKEIKTATPAA